MLNQFVCWPVAPIEKVELLEQLRLLWNGEKIHVECSDKNTYSNVRPLHEAGQLSVVETICQVRCSTQYDNIGKVIDCAECPK